MLILDGLKLTDLLAANRLSLLGVDGFGASTGFQKLHKAVRLLDRDLGQIAIFVEHVEDVALRHPFTRKIAHEQPRSVRELFPVALGHILSFFGQEVVIAELCFGCPWLIVLVQCFSCCLLSLALALELDALLE